MPSVPFPFLYLQLNIKGLGHFSKSVLCLELCLPAVEEQFGPNSIELANELQKVTDVMICELQQIPPHSHRFIMKCNNSGINISTTVPDRWVNMQVDNSYQVYHNEVVICRDARATRICSGVTPRGYVAIPIIFWSVALGLYRRGLQRGLLTGS
uniref:Uncharacterized protein n=1 Tax=Timema poppense TaxID=170557 RepID=A0A7R9DD23_TIMPO|nr:unnamed protein product [Timema poppensis]